MVIKQKNMKQKICEIRGKNFKMY